MRPEFWFPVKPWVVTQAWGIYNPAYLQFGFSRHNGTDVLEGKDRFCYCPIKNMRVYDTGYNDSTGNRVKANSEDIYLFPDGKEARINLIAMHAEKVLCNVGDLLQVGDKMMITDNTGFSTGSHLHIMGRRVHPTTFAFLDQNEADNSFDLAAYANGFYAKDSGAVTAIYTTLIKVLTAMRDLLLKK